MEHFPEKKLVYFSFSAVQDDGPHKLRDFVRDMFALIDKEGVERLVIDMRFNSGGNTDLVPPLIQGLTICEKMNRPGGLYIIIIGRATFSAAQNTVNQIEFNTKATFLGEPTGSRPNFVAEITSFILAHSKQRVFCSSRNWQYVSSIDERVWVQPQIAVEPRFEDYVKGRDACMEAVIEAGSKGRSATTK